MRGCRLAMLGAAWLWGLGVSCAPGFPGHGEGPGAFSSRRGGPVPGTLAATVPAGGEAAGGTVYDPLALAPGSAPEVVDLEAGDAVRGRDIPVRVYLPVGSVARGPVPVVLFSHGLGGTREGYAYLGAHWGARGYAAVFLQHPGSDASVWRDAPLLQRRAAMEDAANGRNFLLRVKDVPAVLDQLEAWNAAAGHPLSGRLDLSRVGMAGHSFGAVTAQAVGGQSFGAAGTRFTDSRIRAVLAMSPSSPRRGDPAAAFGRVSIPWMLLTGTEDVSLIGGTDVASRLAVFPALPAGGTYELVLDGAEHSAFSDRALPGDRRGRNPSHHRAILALSTAFWDTYLRGDSAARAWLQGEGARSVLQEDDRWQWK